MTTKCNSISTFSGILFALFACFFWLWLPTSFFYSELERRQLSLTFNGFFFAAFSAPSIILGCILGKCSARCGRRQLMITGFTIGIISSITLGMLGYAPHSTFFLIGSILTRFFQGTGFIIMRIMCTPLAIINFPSQLNSIFIVFTFVVSSAIFLAPIGASVVSPLGYHWPYIIFSFLFLIIGFPLFIFGLPRDVHIVEIGEGAFSQNGTQRPMKKNQRDDKIHTEQQLNQNNQIIKIKANDKTIIDDREEQKQLRIMKVCCRARVIASLFALFSGLYSQIFYAAILATQFKELGVNDSQIALFVGIRPAAMLLGSLVSILILQKGKRTIIIFFGLMIQVVALMLCGPSQILAFPNKIELVGSGYFLLGLANAFVLLPSMPELIHYLVTKRILSRNKAGDIVSSLVDLIGGFNDLGAPIISALLSESIGYRFTTDVALSVAIIGALLFGFWGNGIASLFAGCKKEKKFSHKNEATSGSTRFLRQKEKIVPVQQVVKHFEGQKQELRISS